MNWMRNPVRPTLAAPVALAAFVFCFSGARPAQAEQARIAAAKPAAPEKKPAAPAAANAAVAARALQAAQAALPEIYRTWLDEVGLLMTKDERVAFLNLDKDYQRDSFMERFWDVRDPYPDTARNELRERWETRVSTARERYGDLKEDRSKMLLLNGPPAAAIIAKCTGTLWPLEAWFYDGSDKVREPFALLFIQRFGSGPYRLWFPGEGIQGLVQQGGIGFNTPDAGGDLLTQVRSGCRNGDDVAAALSLILRQGFMAYASLLSKIEAPPVPPKSEWLATFASYSTDLPEGANPFRAEVTLNYPARRQSRTVVQGLVKVPLAEAGKAEIGGVASYNLLLTGEVLRGRKLFEAFRYKFDFPAAGLAPGETYLPMVFERFLRPGDYTIIIKLEDLNSHKFHRQAVTAVVPSVETPEPNPTALDPESSRLFAEANTTITSGENTLRILRPPAGDLLTGLVRFDTLTTGKKPYEVKFFLNGKPILAKRSPPYGVELDLGDLPRVHQLRVASLDPQGQELASDELRINTNPNRFAVRFVEPKTGRIYKQSVRAEVDVEVPEGEVVERVELFLNDTRVATLYQPPYTQALQLPPGDEISYLRAVAYLVDGNSTERVAFVNAPEILEQVEVSFVELFTTAIDKAGRPVPGLTQADFKIEEDGTPQELMRFEKVENLPVHVEVMLDLSASMEANLEDARQAALAFLEKAVTPKDRGAIVTFNDRPTLAVKLTSDPAALAAGLAGLKAERGTALYDSLVFGLYYLSAVKGQRAVLVLSDGNDESSKFSFDDTLDYARRTGIAVYTIGLGLGRGERDARKKLQRIADETGGQAFVIESIAELPSIYDQVLLELRSKYYLAYQSTNTAPAEKFRTVEVKVARSGVEAKTIRGYYP
jgi:Ca-activated chloride channel homolog